MLVRAAMVLATGELWLFLLQFPLANLCLCVLFARTARGAKPLVAQLAAEVVAALAVLMVTEPTSVYMMLSTAATIALVIAGAAVSGLWFRVVLRKLGLRVRFVPA
jgi:hypothetical protein